PCASASWAWPTWDACGWRGRPRTNGIRRREEASSCASSPPTSPRTRCSRTGTRGTGSTSTSASASDPRTGAVRCPPPPPAGRGPAPGAAQVPPPAAGASPALLEAGTPAWQVIDAAPAGQAVTLTYGNRAITVFRGRVLRRTPEERALAARRRLDDLAAQGL